MTDEWIKMVCCAQSCSTLCDSMDYSPPGSSVHGIFQARILEWVAISSSRVFSHPRDWICMSCIAGGFFTSEPPGKPWLTSHNYCWKLNFCIHWCWIESWRQSFGWSRKGERASLVAQTVSHLPAMQETWVRFLRQEDPLEKAMAIHSSILAWKIPRLEEPGGLQSMGSQRVRHDWVTTTTHKRITVLLCQRGTLGALTLKNYVPQPQRIWWRVFH